MGLVTNSFSVYQPYLIRAGGLSNTQSSEIITVRNLCALLSFFVVEGFLRKTGIRLGAALAAAGAAVSFLLFGASRGLTGYFLAAAAAGVSYGLGGMIAVSVLINRWFYSHRALALGICTVGSGAATILAPPLLTTLIETVSLSAAFYLEAAFIAAASAAVFAILRDNPQQMGLEPLNTAQAELREHKNEPSAGAGRGTLVCMLAAVFMIGAVANTGFSHLSVLYRTAGLDSMRVSFLISFVGVTLTAGKYIYGQATDRLGAYRSGYLFFGLLVAGEILCCFAGKSAYPTALAAMALLGLGLPLSTVGLSVFALDMSAPVSYGRAVKRFQIAYMLGALAFGTVPGMIADATGSYVPAYVILSVFAAASMALVQLSYRRIRRAPAKRTLPSMEPLPRAS